MPELSSTFCYDGADIRALSAEIETAYANIVDGTVAPKWSYADTKRNAEAVDFGTPISLNEALAEAAQLMEHGDLRSASARCFGYFNPTAAWPAVVGDVLAAVRNPQICVTSHAPASVTMERKITDIVCAKLSMPGGTAHFTSGGSEANETAVLAALCRASGGFIEHGVRAFDGMPSLYVSEDSHLAWIKIAKATGLGAAAVRLVPTNGDGRMDSGALADHIAADKRNGFQPIMIAATCGTTGAGMIDPLTDCYNIAVREDIHFHVDAAWAGALIFDENRIGLLAGIERADSVTIDAHKWLSVPMGAGIVALRNRAYAANVFSVKTSYMPEGDGQDFYITTNQWSRRFLGLRLWMMLRVVGEAGYTHMFDQHFALAAYVREQLPLHGWKIRNTSTLPVIVFDDGKYNLDSQTVADAVEKCGKVWLGRVGFEGRSVLRICTTSFLSTKADVDLLIGELNAARKMLLGLKA
jgi:aromatic-L-amino-acid/L-tryptophan decarboxylase